MARDIKLTKPYHELSESFNDIDMVEGDHEIAQSVKIRLLTILGEQFDNAALGVPWLTVMNNSEVPMLVKRAILYRIISGTVGVKKVNNITISHEPGSSLAKVDFSATTNNGKTFISSIEI